MTITEHELEIEKIINQLSELIKCYPTNNECDSNHAFRELRFLENMRDYYRGKKWFRDLSDIVSKMDREEGE